MILGKEKSVAKVCHYVNIFFFPLFFIQFSIFEISHLKVLETQIRDDLFALGMWR